MGELASFDTIQSQSNKLVMGMKIKARGDSELNDNFAVVADKEL